MLFTRAVPSAWLIRKVMEEEDTFAGALKRLEKTHVDSPIYYIISGPGPNDGAVVEKKIRGYHAVY